jgi:hypothetical protein
VPSNSGLKRLQRVSANRTGLTAATDRTFLQTIGADCDTQTTAGRMVRLVVFGNDALLAAVLVFQLGNLGRDTFQLDIEVRQSAYGDRLRSSSYVKEHSSGVAEEKCAEGISGPWPSLTIANLHQLRARRRSHDRTEKAK